MGFSELAAQGGPIFWLLAADALVLAVLVCERVLALYGPSTRRLAREHDLTAVLRAAPAEGGDDLAHRGSQLALAERPELTRHLDGIRVLVWVAPLLGLLGTVDGMIAVFDHLAPGSAPNGLADGIAAALVTTYVGLLIAVPGMIVERLLSRRSLRLAAEQARLSAELIAGLPA
jgi:biopolymer transport protein ExbB